MTDSIFDRLGADFVERFQAAGITTTDMEAARATFTRLPKGKTLHAGDCSAVRRANSVEESVLLTEMHKWKRHAPCWRWHTGYTYNVLDRAQAAVDITALHDEIVLLENRPVPSHGGLGRVRALLGSYDTRRNFSTLKMEDAAEVYQERLQDLEKRWRTFSQSERVQSFVVAMLGCPRESNTVAQAAPGSGIWRVIRPTWVTWARAVMAEESLSDARSAARKTWTELLLTYQSNGQTLEVDAGRVEDLVKLWERTLKKACKNPGVDVLIAWPRLGYNGVSGDARLQKASSAFLGRYDQTKGCYALVVPETVGEWICGDGKAQRLWLGEAGDVTSDTLETFLSLWDPRSRDALGSAESALLTARMV